MAPASDEDLATVFEQRVKPKLKGLAKVIYLVAQPGGTRDGALVLTFPNEGHAKRASELRPEIEQILSAEAGRPARVAVQVESSGSAPATGGAPARDRPPEDEDIDLADLVDAPPETHVSGVHRIAAAFPGAELIEDQS